MTDINTFTENSPSAAWDMVVEMVDSNRAPTRRPEDEVYRKGFHFLKRFKTAYGPDRLSLRRDYPTLFAAFMLFNDTRSERWIIEAGLLTDVKSEELAEYVAQPVGVIEEYEKYFYNVRARLKSRGYILNQVLTPSFGRGMHQRDYDMMYKTMAYCMGWNVFTEFIDRREMSATTRSVIGTGFRDNLIRLGYQATQRMELNNFNAHIVIELCLKLAELESAKGPGGGREDAMVLLQDLLAQCKLAILPSSRPLDFNEPRVDVQLHGAQQLEYVHGKVDTRLLGANNGKDE